MCFNFLCIIMSKCVSSHLVLQTFCSDLIQMWLRFILVSSVLHHIKMHLHQFSSYFNLCFQFFLVSSCFFSSSCRSSVLKRKVTVMMSDYHLNLVSAILFQLFQLFCNLKLIKLLFSFDSARFMYIKVELSFFSFTLCLSSYTLFDVLFCI